jgi:hypothetical protein
MFADNKNKNATGKIANGGDYGEASEISSVS